ncbi:unnamed protein product [Closterium sp. Naga37s-1]|nr:unnamed protein product [Closterium sp. Naga37s-1]
MLARHRCAPCLLSSAAAACCLPVAAFCLPVATCCCRIRCPRPVSPCLTRAIVLPFLPASAPPPRARVSRRPRKTATSTSCELPRAPLSPRHSFSPHPSLTFPPLPLPFFSHARSLMQCLPTFPPSHSSTPLPVSPSAFPLSLPSNPLSLPHVPSPFICLPRLSALVSSGEAGSHCSLEATDSGTANFGHVAVGRGGLRVPDQQQQQDNSLRLADLRKVELLGRGASAAVYLVQHARTGQQYALKDMQLNMDADVQKHVGNELRINHQCRSPHVVRCYQAFVDDGHLFIVLEYMDAGSLADVLQAVGRITEPYLAAISRQALQGLRDLYQGHRIIHRDIKPSNMLLNQSGCLKISDFGVSRVLENSYDVGNTFAGTYTYMSPERIMGRTYSHNSDVWAFGLSLLECAIGQYPYRPASGGSFNYFDLLSEISNSPAPIAPPDYFSPQFCEFVALWWVGWCAFRQVGGRWMQCGVVQSGVGSAAGAVVGGWVGKWVGGWVGKWFVCSVSVRPRALVCGHVHSCAATCTRVRPCALVCGHVHSCAATCTRVQPCALVCGHVHSCALPSTYLFPFSPHFCKCVALPYAGPC